MGLCFLLTLPPPRPPGPAPPVSLSKRRPALQSGAPVDVRKWGAPHPCPRDVRGLGVWGPGTYLLRSTELHLSVQEGLVRQWDDDLTSGVIGKR